MAGLTTGSLSSMLNEGSSFYYTVNFTDIEGNPILLEALQYRLVDSKGLELLPWTTIAPETSTIIIPGNLNVLSRSARPRRLTLRAEYNGGDNLTDEIQYIIKDLVGIN